MRTIISQGCLGRGIGVKAPPSLPPHTSTKPNLGPLRQQMLLPYGEGFTLKGPQDVTFIYRLELKRKCSSASKCAQLHLGPRPLGRVATQNNNGTESEDLGRGNTIHHEVSVKARGKNATQQKRARKYKTQLIRQGISVRKQMRSLPK